jgi:hypothetical protein
MARPELVAGLLLLAGCSDHAVIGHLPADAAAGGPHGLLGEYFANLTLTGLPAFTRLDPALDLLWSTAPPGPGLTGMFSARWQGTLEAPAAGVYLLVLRSDDGSRLWVDGALVIDQWKGGGNEQSVSLPLEAGRRYPLRAELMSYGGSANINLLWSSAELPRQIVPGESLRPP